MKKCYMCHEKLPLSKFHKSGSQQDGFQPYCKECHKAYIKKYMAEYKKTLQYQKYIKEYYQKNRAKIRKQQKECRSKNNKKVREKQTEWCSKNKGRISEYNKAYYQKNRKRISKQRKAARAAL
jgi:hypothetical protein